MADVVAEHGPFARVVEFGSRFINGSVRPLFPAAQYLGIDLVAGWEVDLIADAATWRSLDRFDAVVCCEVAEHTPDWPQILASAHDALDVDGLLIFTAAGPGRAPHSAHDGDAVRAGEHYRNIEPTILETILKNRGFVDIKIDVLGPDIRATARKGP